MPGRHQSKTSPIANRTCTHRLCSDGIFLFLLVNTINMYCKELRRPKETSLCASLGRRSSSNLNCVVVYLHWSSCTWDLVSGKQHVANKTNKSHRAKHTTDVCMARRYTCISSCGYMNPYWIYEAIIAYTWLLRQRCLYMFGGVWHEWPFFLFRRQQQKRDDLREYSLCDLLK